MQRYDTIMQSICIIKNNSFTSKKKLRDAVCYSRFKDIELLQ